MYTVERNIYPARQPLEQATPPLSPCMSPFRPPRSRGGGGGGGTPLVPGTWDSSDHRLVVGLAGAGPGRGHHPHAAQRHCGGCGGGARCERRRQRREDLRGDLRRLRSAPLLFRLELAALRWNDPRVRASGGRSSRRREVVILLTPLPTAIEQPIKLLQMERGVQQNNSLADG